LFIIPQKIRTIALVEKVLILNNGKYEKNEKKIPQKYLKQGRHQEMKIELMLIHYTIRRKKID